MNAATLSVVSELRDLSNRSCSLVGVDTSPQWSKHGLTVICGAGLSIPPPSSVPSWWEFNQTLLAEIVARFIRDSDPPAAMADGVRKLSLADLPIVDISQHVHDAFAGADWFHLLSVLDGTTPNACHIALTTLARAGLLRVVVSTNFDRLVEKAFAWSDQPLDVVVPDRHWQPPGPG